MELNDAIVIIAAIIIIFMIAAVTTFLETPPKYEIVVTRAGVTERLAQ